MADPARRLTGNVPGEFFVDDTCIDCDLCRQIAPSVFRPHDGCSVVFRQPDEAGALRAEMALVTCPTGSIGTRSKRDLRPAMRRFPETIVDDVHFCGFAAESSYGASSYLISRPEGGVLVDSPRYTSALVRGIEEKGGASIMFLTHRDDVADHARFGVSRVMHADDASFAVESEITGSDPVELSPDLLAIPTPGHTRGHMVLLYRNRFLFTGDHLWWNSSRNVLHASRNVCWYSWSEQKKSMERLLNFDFEWVLPGHGRRKHLPAPEMKEELRKLISRM